MRADASGAQPAPAADRDALRLAVATRDYPLTLFSAGGLVILFTVLTYVTEAKHIPMTHVVDGVAAVMLICAGVLFTWGGVSVERQPWIFAAVGAVFALCLLYKVTLEETPLLLAYLVIVLCAFGPCTLAWWPFLSASALILVAVVPVTAMWPAARWIDWTLVCVAATAVSCVLLNARMRGINALADTNAFARQLATTDQLTGLLNRHGFMERVPALSSSADRLDSAVFAVFVDIRGLKQANDRFGHEFGDTVIQAAARTVTTSVRAGDLVARWGGDEVIVVGVGRIPEAEAFDTRLQAEKGWSGANAEGWSGSLSVGFAEGLLSLESIDSIINRADEDMYRRRKEG